MAESKASVKDLDPLVVSRIAHVLWRIENATMIKNASKEQRIVAWNRDKQPHLDKARKIVRLVENVEFIAKKEAS